MSTAYKYFIFLFAAMIFVIAATIGISLLKGVSTNYSSIYEKRIDRDLTEKLQIPEKTKITGDEIIHQLYKIKDIGAIVVVDGIEFTSDLNITKENFSFIQPNGSYRKTIMRNKDGEVMKIYYQREG